MYLSWSNGMGCHDLRFCDWNSRSSYLPCEKSICRSRSKSKNWTWNNTLVPNQERSMSRLYIVTLISYVLFIIGDWNAKVWSQETPGVTGKLVLGIQNEAGQRLIEFCQENALVIANILFQQHKRRLYTWTSLMVNTEIRLIMFFAAKIGEALNSQQKQDRELTVAQIMNSLLPSSDLNWRK